VWWCGSHLRAGSPPISLTHLVVVLMADLREMSLGLSLARYGSAPFA
jgi:hypothetical protein